MRNFEKHADAASANRAFSAFCQSLPCGQCPFHKPGEGAGSCRTRWLYADESECRPKLDACPFCGSVQIELQKSPGDLFDVRARCTSCGCLGPGGTDDDDASKRWNRRSGGGDADDYKLDLAED